MFTARKPRIGFLGIMHGLYDESQPEITDRRSDSDGFGEHSMSWHELSQR